MLAFKKKREYRDLNPNDIDIFTFLDYEVYKKRGSTILDKFGAFSLEDEEIDAYLEVA